MQQFTTSVYYLSLLLFPDETVELTAADSSSSKTIMMVMMVTMMAPTIKARRCCLRLEEWLRDDMRLTLRGRRQTTSSDTKSLLRPLLQQFYQGKAAQDVVVPTQKEMKKVKGDKLARKKRRTRICCCFFCRSRWESCFRVVFRQTGRSLGRLT